MTNEALTDTVQRYLDREDLDGVRFIVDREHVKKLDDWSHVVVHPSHLPSRLNHLYALVADVNEEIIENEGIKVLLITGEPFDAISDNTQAISV